MPPLTCVDKASWMDWMRTHARRSLLASAIAALTASGHAHSAASADEAGVWLDHTGMGAVEITRCGNKLCGNIYWLKQPNNPKGQPLIDIYNPDTSKRGRPICGLPVFGNLAKSGGEWDGGWVYDPKDGKSYDFAMELAGRERLTVTGYMGTRMFGKSMTWTRAPATLPRCGVKPETVAKAPVGEASTAKPALDKPQPKAASLVPSPAAPARPPANAALKPGASGTAATEARAAVPKASAPKLAKEAAPAPSPAARKAKSPQTAAANASATPPRAGQAPTKAAEEPAPNVRSSSMIMDGSGRPIVAPSPRPATRPIAQ